MKFLCTGHVSTRCRWDDDEGWEGDAGAGSTATAIGLGGRQPGTAASTAAAPAAAAAGSLSLPQVGQRGGRADGPGGPTASSTLMSHRRKNLTVLFAVPPTSCSALLCCVGKRRLFGSNVGLQLVYTCCSCVFGAAGEGAVR